MFLSSKIMNQDYYITVQRKLHHQWRVNYLWQTTNLFQSLASFLERGKPFHSSASSSSIKLIDIFSHASSFWKKLSVSSPYSHFTRRAGLLFCLFHTLLLSYVFHFMCCSFQKLFVTIPPFPRFGSRIDAQNGDARKSFARKDARWITWVQETAAQTTTPEMELPEVTAVRMLATQIQSALQCQPRRGYLWTRVSTRCTRQFRNQSQRWLRITGMLDVSTVRNKDFYTNISGNSAMPPSLGSMTSQCLQQRDSYPYMFTDPLHSLSSPYGSHPARSACNPTAAHQQSHYSTSNGGTPTGKLRTES